MNNGTADLDQRPFSAHAGAFLGLLQLHDIQMLADVRQFPLSRRAPWTNKDALAELLAGQGIGYLHMPALGGRCEPEEGNTHSALKNDGFKGYADHMGTGSLPMGSPT